MDNQASAAVGFVMIMVMLLAGLGLYVFYCYCLKMICEKTGHEPGILIWIPIAQIIPLLEVAGMSILWIIGFLIPCLNFIVGIMMWAKICSARGKSPWLVILMFIPIANLIFIPYLAFSE